MWQRSAGSLERPGGGDTNRTLVVDRNHTASDRLMPTKISRAPQLPSRSKVTLSSSTSADHRHRCASAIACSSGGYVQSVSPTASTPLTTPSRPRTALTALTALTDKSHYSDQNATLRTSGQNADWPWIVEYRCPEHPYRMIGDKQISRVRWDDLSNTWIAISVSWGLLSLSNKRHSYRSGGARSLDGAVH